MSKISFLSLKSLSTTDVLKRFMSPLGTVMLMTKKKKEEERAQCW